MPFLRTCWTHLRRVPLEAFIWTAGLVALACTDPGTPGLVQGCLFKWLGVTWCPGCGLGHAVAYLFRGEVVRSFQAHPLGPFAVAVLTGHVARLVRDAFARPGNRRRPSLRIMRRHPLGMQSIHKPNTLCQKSSATCPS